MDSAFELHSDGGRPVLAVKGDWTIWTAEALDARLRETSARLQTTAELDLAGLGRLDLTGAYLLVRAAPNARLVNAPPGADKLLSVARLAVSDSQTIAASEATGLTGLLEHIGRAVVGLGQSALATLSFLGATLVVLARIVRHPRRFRPTSMVAVLQTAGLEAAPIVSLLSFFVGMVLAYVGISTLSDFGLEVFTVEAVGVGVLREFAVVITAVLLAGRTSSAFAAEIGAMRMRQEIDAMRVLGLDPMERLVAPRVLAMTIATPLLTFAAMISGLAGGLLVAWANLGVTPILFITRLQDNVPPENYFIGLLKAPIYGFVLALVACRHGLSVEGDVASLGRETTAAVVESIFWVIVLDAIFAIFVLELGY